MKKHVISDKHYRHRRINTLHSIKTHIILINNNPQQKLLEIPKLNRRFFFMFGVQHAHTRNGLSRKVS